VIFAAACVVEEGEICVEAFCRRFVPSSCPRRIRLWQVGDFGRDSWGAELVIVSTEMRDAGTVLIGFLLGVPLRSSGFNWVLTCKVGNVMVNKVANEGVVLDGTLGG